jgi:hypothetical protein
MGAAFGAVLLLTAAPAAAVRITRGPYLQLQSASSTTVVWNTDVAAACGLRIRALGGAWTTIAGQRGGVCAVAAVNLVPGREYRYIPLANGTGLTSEIPLRTPHPTAKFSFHVVGDSGCACASQMAVRDRMAALPANFILHTGDMVYEDGEPERFDPTFFTPYASLLRRVVLWPSLGNHDIKTARGDPWRAAFLTPANNPASSENYYSFDYGGAHVVVLDSNASTDPGSAQWTFLDRDLGSSTATWKFVVFHHSVYSSGNHGGQSGIRADLVPLFDKHRVDVVFMGHDHHYERTKPLRDGQVTPTGGGTTYVTTGGGGKTIRPVGASTFTAYAESAYHFTWVMVEGATLVLSMVRSDGTIRDAATIHKAIAIEGSIGADAAVREESPQTVFGTGVALDADGATRKRSYLRGVVTGLNGHPVVRAQLRLRVASTSSAGSSSGGRVRVIPDCSWNERTVTWGNQPGLTGTVLDSLGMVEVGNVAHFDVTAAVRRDGVYCFALDSSSDNGVIYRSRESGADRPRLVVEVGR